MRWNALLQPNFEHEATASLQPLQPLQPLQSLQPSARRWWLGWLQLLFAWVVCMLLCANIALAFAEGLPQVKQASRSGKAVGCAATGSPAPHGPQRVERAGPVKGQTPVC
ncbi:hypothetical protein [Variovorax sp. RCC_210]|jgi:hypothetical protein|uniref:hypothetical protein n=1 Tax=Variovorax sp. RCC_210 TaxID=3239217 RepID=UPI003524538F